MNTLGQSGDLTIEMEIFHVILKAIDYSQKLDSQIFSCDYLLVQQIKMGTKFKKLRCLLKFKQILNTPK